MHRTLDISDAEQQTISLCQTHDGNSELLQTLASRVDLAQRLRPERGVGFRCAGSESGGDNGTDPVVTDDEVRRICPLLEENSRQRRGVPIVGY